VYGNVLVDNFQGLTALNNNYRGSGSLGAYLLSNLYVHDNEVHQTTTTDGGSGRSGIAEYDANSTQVFTSLNNRFVNNTYYLTPQRTPFFWMHKDITEHEWQGYGQDVGGRLVR
jgi:hypothetical protein